MLKYPLLRRRPKLLHSTFNILTRYSLHQNKMYILFKSVHYNYFMRGYSFNHIESIGYRLEIGSDIFPYKYKGYGRLRTPEHIPIESIYFIYLYCPRSICNITLVVTFAYPHPPLFDSTLSRSVLGWPADLGRL